MTAPTPAELLACAADPADAGRRAAARRDALFGPQVWIRPAPAHPLPPRAAVLRGDTYHDLSPAPGPQGHAPSDLSPAPGPQGHVPADMSLPPAPESGASPVAGASPSSAPPSPVADASVAAPPSHAPPVALDGRAWPDPAALRPGDRLVLVVAHADAAAYAAWLARAAAAAPGWTIAPVCASPGGLHRLWLLAAARLALPAGVRVEVRHDLCGIRLAQVALGFGADTLAGPIDPVRHLPLAGVPRPSEATADGLCELVRQAGLTPVLEEPDR